MARTSPASQEVSVEREGPVAVITVDNPPVNAMSDSVLDGLRAAFAAIDGDEGVRSVVLAAAGERLFAAGANLKELAETMRDPAAVEAHLARTDAVFGAIAAVRQPVVAAVHAPALGGGFELVLACDFAVVDETAELGLPEVGLGLIPGAGGTQRLSRRIGSQRALRAILLGERLSAAEALDFGAITALAAPGSALADSRALAARLAALPATAVQSGKRAVAEGAELRLSEGLALERDLFAATTQTADAREGVAAFIERRPASFGQVQPSKENRSNED
jgi:enoyl-CoA hydratase/carnithine racemase